MRRLGRALRTFGALAVIAALAAEAPAAIEAAAVDVQASEDVPFTGTVARIFPFGGQVPGDFTATIDWGDGTVSAGSVEGGQGGVIDVRGTHVYADAGSFPLGIVIDGMSGDDHIELAASALVQGNAIGVDPKALRAVEGVRFVGLVATLSDRGATPPFTAIVDYIDEDDISAHVVQLGPDIHGILAAGTLGRGGFVAGTVTVRDSAGAEATATSHVLVGEAVPRLRATLERDPDGVTVTLRGSFSDTTSEAHEATIDWGDGASETVALGTSQQGEFTREHAYSRKDAKRIFGRRPKAVVLVTVADAGGTPSPPAILPDPFAGEEPPVPKPTPACRDGGLDCAIERLFVDARGRRPTAAELAALVAQAADGPGRGAAAEAILLDPEARGNLLEATLGRVLDRRPTKKEVAAALAALQGGATEEEVLAAAISSPITVIVDVDFGPSLVRQVAAGVLGRSADPPLHQLYRDTLAGGGAPRDFVLAVLQSDEARRRAIHETYDRYLHRPPAPGEVASALSAYENAGTIRGVLIALLLPVIGDTPPPAASAVRRATAEERFVHGLFRDLLGREGDPSTVARWEALLDLGVARTEVSAAFLDHPEFRAREAGFAYRSLLGREPTEGESAAAVQAVLGTGTIREVEAGILASDEYFALTGGSDRDWFLAAYDDMRGSSNDDVADAVSAAVAFLGAGGSRTDVVRQLLASPESRAAEIEGMFQRFLGRRADAEGGAVLLLPYIEQDDVHKVLASILGSNESYRRPGPAPKGIRDRREARTFLDGVATALVGSQGDFDGNGDAGGTDLAALVRESDGRRRAVEAIANSEAAQRRRLTGFGEDLLQVVVAEADADPTLLAMLRDGAADEDVMAAILASDEFLARAHEVATGAAGPSTGEDFLAALHLQLLGRRATTDEVAFATTAFPFLATDPQGPTWTPSARAAVARALLASQEFRRRFVTDLVLDPLDTARIRRLASSPAGLADLRVTILAGEE